MALHRPLASGRTADVYPWQDDLVIKLFHDWVPDSVIEHEADVARAVYAAGLPVPAAGDLLEVSGRRGLLYERVRGATMLDALRARPRTLFRSARQLAELQATIHSRALDLDLPSQRERLIEKVGQVITLSQEQRAAILNALAQMPAGHSLCHGDLHLANVILARRGPVIIDWIDATLGNPLADVARTSLIPLGAAQEETTAWPQKIILRAYHGLYLKAYFRRRPGGGAEYRAWRPIVAAVRMSEGIEGLEGWLAAQAGAVRHIRSDLGQP